EASLVGAITDREVVLAIRAGRVAAAPGPDGLPYGFYQAFGGILARPLAEVYDAVVRGECRVGEAFSQGFLRLLPKEGDLTLIANWRPLTLSNVDHRVLARILLVRLVGAVGHTVHPGQTSAVPGRRMDASYALMREVFGAVAAGQWRGLVVRLDQSKAFDRVRRDYLWEVLKDRGVPEHVPVEGTEMMHGAAQDGEERSSREARVVDPQALPSGSERVLERTTAGDLVASDKHLHGASSQEMPRGTALRAEEPVAWWQALKREVGRRCWALVAVTYRREIQDYHRALARFLTAVRDINRVGGGAGGGRAAAARRAEDERVIAQFHQRKCRQRLQGQRYWAKGPVVALEEWARAHAAGGPKGREQPRPFVGLRLAERDPVEDSVQGMLGVMGRFYGDLFTPRRVPAPGEVEAFLQRVPFPAPGAVGQGGLTEQQRAALVSPVSPEEVRAGIKAGRSASAPGADGLPYFFFQRFADLLAEPLAAAFNAALQGRARFSDSFFAGLLRFFFKGGDPTLAQNWHPIAVTNVDYRLLARVLSARLAAVASRLVAEGQSNAVPGRRMGTSLALMREQFLAAAGGRGRGLLVQLDQSKAFGRVDRAYLWAVLHARGVPEGFICLLQRLYERATAVPVVEGWRGDPVPLASGLRQGCPLSPLLYVLALDPLLEAVRADGRITGRVRFFSVYCIPAALGLAAVYPPPRAVLAAVTEAFFHFVWGCRCFPLPRAVAYRRVGEGGLGARALGPLFLATFLAANFGAWEHWHEAVEGPAGPGGTPLPAEVTWRSFGQSWSHSQWALWWWHGDQVGFWLTAHPVR
ncbi:hypothetical protein lerEdw1_014512, partial [Lerista edwardsae]